MLQFILGRSGYGKTSYIREKIKQKVLLGKKVILIVPEQFSFESERALYFELGATLSINVDVLSFTRLAHSVFREYGGTVRPYISKGGKSVLLNLAISQVYEKLDIYKKSKISKGFISQISSTITEIKQAGITPELLQKSAQKTQGAIKQKTKELAIIINAYNALLEQGYADADDDILIALELLRKNNYFKDTYVFIDEFNGLTAVEIDILECCLKGCTKTYIGLCTDPNIKTKQELGLFACVNNFIKSVTQKAQKNNIKILPSVKLYSPKRFNNKYLQILEKNIFSPVISENSNKKLPVSIYLASGYYSEIEYICATIKELIFTKNISYKDIAIIGRNIGDYYSAIESIMQRYEIPYFYNINDTVANKPLIVFVLSLLKAVAKNYDNNSILAVLKTGLTPITTEQIALIENYIYTWSIKGRMWNSAFVQNPRGFCSEFLPDDISLLEDINKTREYIINIINNLKQSLDNTTGEEFVKNLFTNLDQISLEQNYINIINKQTSHTNKQNYIRIWELFCDTLDEMGTILKNINMTTEKFTQLLQIMLEALDMGDIPQNLDEVLVGDASLIRPNSPLVVFVIGANEGIFPLIPENNGIFTDAERKQLIELGFRLTFDLEKQIINEQFIAYKALTSSSHSVYITYSAQNISGKPLTPSPIVTESLKIFNKSNIICKQNLPKTYFVQNITSSYHELAKVLQTDSSERATIIKYLSNINNKLNNNNFNLTPESLINASKAISFKIANTKLAELCKACNAVLFR